MSTKFRSLPIALIALLSVMLLPVADVGAQGVPPPPPGGGIGAAGYLHPLNPARILDTRNGTGASGPVGPGREVSLQVTGRGGVPSGASAVVLNVTVTRPTGSGYVTAYPSGTKRPLASNLNFRAGQTVPNLVVARVGANGRVNLFNSSGHTHLVADVMGWYDDVFASMPDPPAGGSRQQAISPSRLLDTRTNSAAVGAGREIELQVTGRGGIPANATAVALNVTAVRPSTGGYVTVFPSGSSRPTASNLNFGRGQIVPNMVIAKVGAGGRIKLFNSSGDTHLVVDATAYFAPVTQALGGGEFNALDPARVLDTRSGLGAPARKVGPGQDVSLKVTGAGGVMEFGVDSVVLNVTVTQPSTGGYITVHPSDTARPTASNLNFRAGQTVPNLVIAKVGADGRVKLHNSAGSSHLIADVVGFFNSGMSGGGTPPTPTADGPGGSEPIGGGPVDDLPAPIEGGAPDSLATPVSDSTAVPTAEEAANAPVIDSLVESPVAGDGPVQQTQAQMLQNEPIYPIRSHGYAGSVSTAVGRVFGWDYINGKWYRSGPCSGTVVGRDIVLTAAHCLKGAGNGAFEAFSFIPGLRGGYAPKGEWFAAGSRAWTDSHYNSYANSKAQILFDYGFVKLDASQNGGRVLSSYTGSFPIMMDAGRTSASKFAVGYPVEGRFSSTNGGSCSRWSWECLPYYCDSANTYTATFGNGWNAVGWGCAMNGGMSGSGVFSNINGRWYVVSLTAQGGYNMDRNNNLCWVRSSCSWYMANSWGPEFEKGYLDAVWRYVSNA